MGRILGLQDVEAAIRGGSVFAAGGGWADHGRMFDTTAVTIGQAELVAMDAVTDDAFIATAAAIGAPLYGLMIGQNGMSSTINACLGRCLAPR